MSASLPPEEGDVHIHERTFTYEDVLQFAEVSGDAQEIHTNPDGEGRLVVQGLLTATLPTKIGGDLGCIARTMEFDFLKPVRTGATISCIWTNENVEERGDRFDLTSSVDCNDEDEETVMEGHIEGVIWKGQQMESS